MKKPRWCGAAFGVGGVLRGVVFGGVVFNGGECCGAGFWCAGFLGVGRLRVGGLGEGIEDEGGGVVEAAGAGVLLAQPGGGGFEDPGLRGDARFFGAAGWPAETATAAGLDGGARGHRVAEMLRPWWLRCCGPGSPLRGCPAFCLGLGGGLRCWGPCGPPCCALADQGAGWEGQAAGVQVLAMFSANARVSFPAR